MNFAELCIWGDSIAKGVIYDEARGRYAVCRENCISRLAREKGIPVSNYAVMGQTSENGIARMQPASMKSGAVAVIEYGGNDCDLDWKAVSDHPEERQLGKVPLDRFEENMEELVRRAREYDMLPVLVTPPPLISQRYFEWVSRGLNPVNIMKYLGDVEAISRWQEGYAKCVANLAARLNVRLLDIRSRMLEAGDVGALMCRDGIHPNERGHALIFDAVVPLLV